MLPFLCCEEQRPLFLQPTDCPEDERAEVCAGRASKPRGLNFKEDQMGVGCVCVCDRLRDGRSSASQTFASVLHLVPPHGPL